MLLHRSSSLDVFIRAEVWLLLILCKCKILALLSGLLLVDRLQYLSGAIQVSLQLHLIVGDLVGFHHLMSVNSVTLTTLLSTVRLASMLRWVAHIEAEV